MNSNVGRIPLDQILYLKSVKPTRDFRPQRQNLSDPSASLHRFMSKNSVVKSLSDNRSPELLQLSSSGESAAYLRRSRCGRSRLRNNEAQHERNMSEKEEEKSSSHGAWDWTTPTPRFAPDPRRPQARPVPSSNLYKSASLLGMTACNRWESLSIHVQREEPRNAGRIYFLFLNASSSQLRN